MRAASNGEIKEYRLNVTERIPLTAPTSDWYDWLKLIFVKLAAERSVDASPYMKIKQ